MLDMGLLGLSLTKRWRQYLMGKEVFPKEELTAAVLEMYHEIEHDPDTARHSLEDLLHELSHHVTLRNNIRRRRRGIDLETEIERLSPMAQEGNELDAMAVDLDVLYWLGHPESPQSMVVTANLSYFGKRQARSLLTRLRKDPGIQELAVMLARAIQRRARRMRRTGSTTPQEAR